MDESTQPCRLPQCLRNAIKSGGANRRCHAPQHTRASGALLEGPGDLHNGETTNTLALKVFRAIGGYQVSVRLFWVDAPCRPKRA